MLNIENLKTDATKLLQLDSNYGRLFTLISIDNLTKILPLCTEMHNLILFAAKLNCTWSKLMQFCNIISDKNRIFKCHINNMTELESLKQVLYQFYGPKMRIEYQLTQINGFRIYCSGMLFDYTDYVITKQIQSNLQRSFL